MRYNLLTTVFITIDSSVFKLSGKFEYCSEWPFILSVKVNVEHITTTIKYNLCLINLNNGCNFIVEKYVKVADELYL